MSKREIIVETDDDFESCDDCVHSDDTEEICKMRGCTHAISNKDIKECYEPKEYTKAMLKAMLDSMEKYEKIEKIVNKPFCEGESEVKND